MRAHESQVNAGTWGSWSGWSAWTSACGQASHQTTRICNHAATCDSGCPGNAVHGPFTSNTIGAYAFWVCFGFGGYVVATLLTCVCRVAGRPGRPPVGRQPPARAHALLDAVRLGAPPAYHWAVNPHAAVRMAPIMLIPNLVPAADGGWSSWAAWSAWSGSCNSPQTRTRGRGCTNPTPTCGGQSCSGTPTQQATKLGAFFFSSSIFLLQIVHFHNRV